jgi:hypothetical protein
MSIRISLVEKAMSLLCFKKVERIYLASFPVSQIRPTKLIIRMHELDPKYHLILVRKYDTKVGFALLYTFNELSIAFLDFMAIDEAYRDRDMGSMIFKYTLTASKWLVTNSIVLILEVEREKITEPDKNG